MKSVMLSIQPKWVEKIVNLEKTIEVRKTRPKIETPFKCYIYMSQGDLKDLGSYSEWIYKNRMKVIGEFICDRIDEYKYVYCDHPEIGYPVGYDCGDNWYDIDDEDLQKACLTEEEFKRYGNGKPLYGWHISNLKIYYKPKELSEFGNLCRKDCLRLGKGGKSCKFLSTDGTPCNRIIPITRPPQSWMYVEEVEQ